MPSGFSDIFLSGRKCVGPHRPSCANAMFPSNFLVIIIVPRVTTTQVLLRLSGGRKNTRGAGAVRLKREIVVVSHLFDFPPRFKRHVVSIHRDMNEKISYS